MDNAEDIEEEMEPYMDLLLDIAEIMIATKNHLNKKNPDELTSGQQNHEE